MKKTNIFGAVLCSAALACSMAMPAFAAPAPTVGAPGSMTDAAKGETVVSGITSDSEVVEKTISATVPVAVSVVLPSPNSGNIYGDLICPSEAKYRVYNTGSTDIKVDKVAASASSGFTLTSTTVDAPVAVTDKTIQMKVNNTNLTSTPTELAGATTIATGDTLGFGLTLSGSIGIGKNFTTSDYNDTNATYELLTIMYTIAEVPAKA